jgi:hypothetical protein
MSASYWDKRHKVPFLQRAQGYWVLVMSFSKMDRIQLLSVGQVPQHFELVELDQVGPGAQWCTPSGVKPIGVDDTSIEGGVRGYYEGWG